MPVSDRHHAQPGSMRSNGRQTSIGNVRRSRSSSVAMLRPDTDSLRVPFREGVKCIGLTPTTATGGFVDGVGLGLQAYRERQGAGGTNQHFNPERDSEQASNANCSTFKGRGGGRCLEGVRRCQALISAGWRPEPQSRGRATARRAGCALRGNWR